MDIPEHKVYKSWEPLGPASGHPHAAEGALAAPQASNTRMSIVHGEAAEMPVMGTPAAMLIGGTATYPH